jgi:hypothetical protein
VERGLPFRHVRVYWPTDSRGHNVQDATEEARQINQDSVEVGEVGSTLRRGSVGKQA